MKEVQQRQHQQSMENFLSVTAAVVVPPPQPADAKGLLETCCAEPLARENAVVSAAAAAAAAAVVAAATPPRTSKTGRTVLPAAGLAASAALSAGAAVGGEGGSVWDLDSLDFEDEDEEGGSKEQEEEGHAGDGDEKDEPKRQAEVLRLPVQAEEGQQGSPEAEPVRPQEGERRRDGSGGGRHGAKCEDEGQASLSPPQRHNGVSVTSATASAERRPCQADLGNADGWEGATSATTASAVVVTAVPCDRARELMPPPPPNLTRAKMRRRRSRVSLMHSPR